MREKVELPEGVSGRRGRTECSLKEADGRGSDGGSGSGKEERIEKGLGVSMIIGLLIAVVFPGEETLEDPLGPHQMGSPLTFVLA